jgi:methylmalonyl-CoA mutase N-terminal domain/subunit
MKVAARDRTNRSGVPVKPIYGPEDVHRERVGEPGAPPFTRGIYPEMYRERLWSKRQLIGLDTPESFNERQRALIDAGQTAVNLTICNSTYRGLDIDEVPRVLIGTCGTPINCQEDVRICFDGMRLDELSLAINDPTPFPIAARLLVLAEERGVPWDRLRGTSNQSDFLSHYVANHMFLRLTPRGSLRVLVDHIRFMQDHVPGWNPVSVVGQHMQQAGATPLQALAFTLCTAIEYVRAATGAGLDIDEFGHRVTFFHDISLSLFEEVAKLRAQRRMWATIMRDWFGAREERTLKFKVHTQTSGADLVQADPLNNVVRITVQALAAILGGTQSLHTDAFDEAYATPTEAAARLALMTQHILSDETGVPDVVDPLGGSYYVEALTDEMEERAWVIVHEVERRGGMLQACEDGYVQDEIGRSAWEYQMAIERGERAIVGVTRHAADAAGRDEELPVQRVDEGRVTMQIERVQRSRRDRDQQRAERARDRLIGLASDHADNAFAATIDAVRAGLTHGEIVAAARQAFGDGRPRPVL